MGIFSRLGTLIKSNLNDLISKAEDPEKMLNQVLTDMKTQLVEAKKQVAVAIGDEKRLKKQWEDQGAQSKEWERKAMLAVQAGDDELAKEALTRQKEHEELSGELTGDTLQERFKRLESGSVSADAQLQALKAKMGLAALPASSSAGQDKPRALPAAGESEKRAREGKD